jgi:hypothetical protein
MTRDLKGALGGRRYNGTVQANEDAAGAGCATRHFSRTFLIEIAAIFRRSGGASSIDALLSQLVGQLRKFNFETEVIRAVDHDFRPAPAAIRDRWTLGPRCASSG